MVHSNGTRMHRRTAALSSRLLSLLLKVVGRAKLRESDIHPISPKTPAQQCQPIDRKKRKGKIVEDYSRDRAASLLKIKAGAPARLVDLGSDGRS